jgi:hypothetical protein
MTAGCGPAYNRRQCRLSALRRDAEVPMLALTAEAADELELLRTRGGAWIEGLRTVRLAPADCALRVVLRPGGPK